MAAQEVQDYLTQQKDWQHNFGLSAADETPIVGKMFGVLVVKTEANEIGYLAAFSGKLAGKNQHTKFVPPVFDLLEENGFLTKGMQAITALNLQIEALSAEQIESIKLLKAKRKELSVTLQNEIFEKYHFLNQSGTEKSLTAIFTELGHKNPPAGAGECAAPKLLQYAFQHQMKPLALAEFWWGLSPKSATWQHQKFYACCKEKCEPILAHMLLGL